MTNIDSKKNLWHLGVYLFLITLICTLCFVLVYRTPNFNDPSAQSVLITSIEPFIDNHYGEIFVLYYTIDFVPYQQYFKTRLGVTRYIDELSKRFKTVQYLGLADPKGTN